MSNPWQSKMKNVISDMLETMFFLTVDFESGEKAVPFSLQSDIGLARDLQKIRISLLVTEPFARVAAANFLGVEEDEVTTSDLEDVVKELANMIGGNYMTLLEDDNWALGIPTVKELEGIPEISDEVLPISYFGEPAGAVLLHTE